LNDSDGVTDLNFVQCWYACWNLFGWVYCYFLLPETKALTLEELDTVFNVGNRDHAKYYTQKLPWYVGKYIMRRDVMPIAPMYEFEDEPETRHNSVSDQKAAPRATPADYQQYNNHL
jgi:hypothetical protein